MTILEGERIVLRSIQADDIDAVFEQMRRYPDMGEIFTESLLSELVMRSHFGGPGIEPVMQEECFLVTALDGELLGSIAYFKGHRWIEGVELSYHIFRGQQRGKGYMEEAVNLLLHYLFTTKNILRIQVNIEKGNIASRRTVEKCGFRFDGTMRRALLCGQTWQDIEMFSLLRDEWLS